MLLYIVKKAKIIGGQTMFGRDNNQPVQDNSAIPAIAPTDNSAVPNNGFQQGATGIPMNNGVDLNDIPSVPVISNNPISDSMVSTPEVPTEASPEAVDTTAPVTPPKKDDMTDLLDLKQKALHDLSPLVNQLEQTPEEKFRTTMMMIQASDDKTLLPQAYKLAQEIKDEKVKAQSLLDVINEINYFTQN